MQQDRPLFYPPHYPPQQPPHQPNLQQNHQLLRQLNQHPHQSEYAYHHRKSQRARSFRLSINQQGEVIVTTPPRYSQTLLDQFLRESEEWVEKHLALYRRRSRVGSEQDHHHALLYGGIPHTVDVRIHDHETGVERSGTILIVRPVSPTKDSCVRAIERWLKAEAERYMVPRAHELSVMMHVKFQSLQFRDQSTRWGSCSSRKKLQLNWRLIQAPKEVIDYVMMHELTHLVHMNHSERFWAYVERFDPAYADHRKWLRFHGAALHKDLRSHPAFCSLE